MLLEWQHYEPDTWAAESEDHIFLIKMVTDDEYVFVFGTLDDAAVTGSSRSLTGAQAIANRYQWLVNNVTGDRLTALINKL